MFLDEELEQMLFAKKLKTKEDVAALERSILRCMVDRLPEPNEMSIQGFLTEIKKIDNAWRLFCKNHQTLEFKEDFWRNEVLCNDKDGSLKRALGW